MKTTHRSEKLDAFLNQRVRITFWDNVTKEGKLIFNAHYEAPLYLTAGRYFLLLNNGCYLRFAKSSVKQIEKI